MRSILAVTVLLALAGGARADESRTRSIWLECQAPAGWPDKLQVPTRLTCRLENAVTGPAYWQTLNPFVHNESLALVDPFEIEATARLVDPFEGGRPARPRAQRPALPSLDLPSATIDPFESPAPTAPPSDGSLD